MDHWIEAFFPTGKIIFDRMPLSAIDLAGLSPAEGVVRMPL
jgi:hypothetical protein